MGNRLRAWDGFGRQDLKTCGRVLAVALGYLLLGRASFAASVSHEIVTLVVFGAEGLSLAAALRWGRPVVPGVFLGQLALALSMGMPLGPALAVSAANAFECALAVWLGRRLKLDVRLQRVRDVLWLLGLSALVLQPLSALLGVGSLWSLHRMAGADLPVSLFNWWLGNVLGQWVMAPAVLVLLRWPVQPWTLVSGCLAGMLGAWAFGLVGGGVSTFALALGLCFPLVVGISARLGVEGGSMASLGLAVMAVLATSLGRGPFRTSWVELDFFLAGGTVTGLVLGALFTERRRLEQDLRERNEALASANLELSQALAAVDTLEGLLPICAYCKQIRDDEGTWNRMEDYIASRSHVSFSHGICPHCKARMRAEHGLG